MRSKLSCPFGTSFYPEPPVRRRGRSRARSGPRVASRRRQRDLRDDKPKGQDDVNAKFKAETPLDTELIPPAVPLIQPMFKREFRVCYPQ